MPPLHPTEPLSSNREPSPTNGAEPTFVTRESLRSAFSVPAGLRDARTTPPLRAVAGVAILGLLVAVMLLGRWWLQEASSQEQLIPAASATDSVAATAGPAAIGVVATATAGAGAGAAPEVIAPASEAATVPTTLVVHVAGRVAKPGVVTVPGGARVIDAVTKAGGLAKGADGSTVNLARPVVDGEQIVVLAQGESPPASSSTASTAQPAAPGTGPSGAPAKVDLNRADQAQLETLPGVGPVLAGRIIEWRDTNGKFSSVDQLGEVSGVGEKTLQRLAPLVSV